jgi:hypothetical protein
MSDGAAVDIEAMGVEAAFLRRLGRSVTGTACGEGGAIARRGRI